MLGMDRPLTRDMRQKALAINLSALDVKTTSICIWTGLRERAVRKLVAACREEFGFASTRRACGGTVTKLLRSPRMRAEFAAAGGLCRAMGVVPRGASHTRQPLPPLERAELMVQVYRAYVDVVPHSMLSMQALFSLMTLLAGDEWRVGGCRTCGAAVLVQDVANSRRICLHCRRDGHGATQPSPRRLSRTTRSTV